MRPPSGIQSYETKTQTRMFLTADFTDSTDKATSLVGLLIRVIRAIRGSKSFRRMRTSQRTPNKATHRMSVKHLSCRFSRHAIAAHRWSLRSHEERSPCPWTEEHQGKVTVRSRPKSMNDLLQRKDTKSAKTACTGLCALRVFALKSRGGRSWASDASGGSSTEGPGFDFPYVLRWKEGETNANQAAQRRSVKHLSCLGGRTSAAAPRWPWR